MTFTYTDLLDDDVSEILKVSEGRWQIEDCFQTMKTDFEACPVCMSREERIKTHFLTCFLMLLFLLLKRELKSPCTTQQLLGSERNELCRYRRTGIYACLREEPADR